MAGRRALLAAMLREEWRLHARLFGGGRFGALPAVVLLASTAAVELLVRVGTDLGGAVAGVHLLVAFVGVQTGSVGLAGRDALDSLLGDVTLLVGATDDLPIRRRDVLAVFVVHDLLYYAAYFVAPLALALVPAVARGRLPLAAVPRLFASATLALLFGVGVTLAALALRSRGRAGRLALAGAATGVAALVAVDAAGVRPLDLAAFTPYALYAGPLAPAPVAVALAPTAGLLAVGLLGVDPDYVPPSRTADAAFATWRRRLRDDDGLLTRTLVDVARSDGGLLKVPFSAGVVLLVAVALVRFAGRITGVEPDAGVAVGALLSLTAFTTHSWLAGFDSLDDYASLPVAVADVFRAKFRAFLLLGPAAGLLAHLAGVAYLGASPASALVGAALLVGLQSYLYGVTVYAAGLRPDEFLFDALLFAGFTAAVAVALVPVLVAAFALPASSGAYAALLVASALASLAGVVLARRAPRRWAATSPAAR
jgi:hypothetical protein